VVSSDAERKELTEDFAKSILDEACSKSGVVNPSRNGIVLHACVNGCCPGFADVKLKVV
jgi:hypothetical protein